MPELPEVETIKRGLAKKLPGKTISQFDSDWHKTINYPLAKYRRLIKGKKIKQLRRRAKMLIIDLSDDWHILVHLKMTGQLVYQTKNQCLIGGHQIEESCVALPNKFTHAMVTFSDGSRLFFNDIRKFGWFRLYRTAELEKVLANMAMGPEPLEKEFTLNYLVATAKRRPRTKIKQFIMDNKNLVGVGNIYSDEILFFAKVKPNRLVGKVKQQEWGRIYQGIRKILQAAIKAQGTTFSNYVNADGQAGGFVKKLKVYQRYGKKCYKCASKVVKMKLGGRTASFCPRCQK